MPQRRNRRGGVEDRWTKTIRDTDGNTQTVPSANAGKGKRWRARYVDESGREHAKVFARKVDAQRWLNGQITALGTGTHVPPRDAALTVAQWCDQWLKGYEVNRRNTVRNARFHIAVIDEAFGDRALTSIRPSEVKSWVSGLQADGSLRRIADQRGVRSAGRGCRFHSRCGPTPDAVRRCSA